MFLLDLLFAIVTALLLTGLFGMLFRRMTVGEGLLLFFVILFLATWAGGVWIAPIGPLLFDVSWLSFLLVGLFVVLLLTILIPPARPRSVVHETPGQVQAEAEAAIVMDVFFWVLIIGLLAVIVIAYM